MSNQYSGGLITKTPTTPNSISAPGVWTLSQQAAAQATNTWPFPRDAQFNYVTMLLQGNGSGGPTSNGSGAGASPTVMPFNSDASTNNFNVTINGDARSNNFTPYQGNGYYSNYFDGNGDSLTLVPGAAFAFGTGDFTVEAWLYPTAATGSGYIIDARNSGQTSTWSFNFGYGGTASELDWGSSGSIIVAGNTTAVIVNQWNHVAYTRSGTTGSLYVNGVRIATATDSTNYSTSPTTSYIGSRYSLGTDTFTGYMSNVRVVKGTAVYTGTSYTVPTSPLTAITNTVLLTCQSNRFIDNSTNAFALTKVGETAVASAQPFTLPSSVATYGSGYFDGSGDFLTTPASASLGLTGNWTVEGWVYPTSYGANANTLFDCRTGGTGFAIYSSLTGFTASYPPGNGGSGSVGYATNSALVASSTTKLPLNAWSHIAVTRSSNTITCYINGVSAFTYTDSRTFASSTTYVVGGDGTSPTYVMAGNITDLRVVNGTAIYTTAFTPPTAPLTAVSGTSLLTTQYNGGGNNSGFKDSSQNNFPITRNGNTTQGTFTPYGSNWSNYFNGSSYLQVSSNSALNMNTYCCLEAWVCYSSLSTNTLIIGRDSSYWLGYDFSGIGGAATKLVFGIYNGSSWQAVSSSTTPVVGVWYHVVGIKDNTTLRIYINGTQENTATFSGTPATGATPFGIASNQNTQNMTGYISNGRLVLGSSASVLPYTSNFTSSNTPLTAVSGTALLTCQSNKFVDNSTNAFTVSPNGSPSVQRFSPFSPTTAYSTSVIGGSGYFDGSGDYLSVASQTALGMGAGDFTYEAWIYVNEIVPTNALRGLFDSRVSGATGCGIYTSADTGTTSKLVYTTNSAIAASSTNTIKAYAWTHVAVTRSGTTVRGFLNGVLEFTYTDSRTFSSSAGTYIGADVTPAYFNGFINDARILKGTAQYTSAFTPPTAPLTAITNTSLLLSYTNAGILDNAMMNDLETLGNAQISTSVKKYGTGSMYFDGSGDYLTVPSSPNLGFGSGDFTVEAWVYLTANIANATGGYLTDFRGGSTNNFALGFIGDSGVTKMYEYVNSGTAATTGSATVTLNTWNHVAWVRSGSTVTMYLNGTSNGTITSSYSQGATTVTICSRYTGATEYITGYIDDLRITKGVARYTANFTVPDQAFKLG